MELVLVLVVLGALIAVFGVRALLVFVRKLQLEAYWQTKLTQKSANDSLKLVALGDSVSVGVGATSPSKTLVGLAGAYVEAKTGRPVQIANYSRSGATANIVLETQLPKAKLASADIILLEIGANDSFRRTPGEYKRDMQKIIAALPLEKTVIADLPYVIIRQPYQTILNELLANKAVSRANVSTAFEGLKAARGTTAGDFFHPNNRGYKLWFEAFRPGINEILRQQRLLKTETK